MGKPKTSGRIVCFVCCGSPPFGKCLICGQEKGDNGKPNTKWAHRHLWLRELFNVMKKHNMTTTGNPQTDLEIARKFGPWRRDLEIKRDPWSACILHIGPPKQSEPPSQQARMELSKALAGKG